MTASSGGYLIHKTPLVRTGTTTHTAALDRPVSDLDLKALNTVQETPWRINVWLLEVMTAAFDADLSIGGLQIGDLPTLPDRMTDEAWAATSPEDRKRRSADLHRIHTARATHTGRQSALLDKLQIAEALKEQDAFYYPHSRCFRGRIYPVATSGPHPQGDDRAKALLEFARGKALGPDGFYWLCVHAANTFGMDKLDLVDRVQWTLSNAEAIGKAVDDPLGTDWWHTAAAPWCFLAACRELVECWDTVKDETEGYVSHLPISMDGSCNGLQHLSAMALDPIGARATNLSPGPRQDIYEDVARIVRRKVEADAALGVAEALQWHGRITRDTCKRAVMTTPYGVTDRGIRNQLVTGGFVPDESEDRGACADYLRDCLVMALGETIEAGRAIMAWLQTVADRLARAGLPFDWTNPSGSKCRQAYYASTRREVDTLVGRLILTSEVSGGTLPPRKAALGAAPNYVHAADSAHLSMTVVAAADEGITDFAMIHDSFATHACNTTRLSTILREQFVAIYEKDMLADLYVALCEAYPHVDIPVPPARGSFDIKQVLDAPFFFS